MSIPYHSTELSPSATLLYGRVPSEVEHLLLNVILSDTEQVYFQGIKNERRKAEWLYARYLLQQKNPDFKIEYAESGKPFLKNQPLSLSISHTGDFVAVLISEHSSIGLDVQLPKQQLFRIRHKFIHENEKKWMDVENLSHLCLLWSAKEALYKLYGKRGLDFKENMKLVSTIDQHQPDFQLKLATTNIQQCYTVKHFEIDGIIIAWIAA